MVAKIARGVHAAHMAGLVHCDLKPNNIVLTASEEPKVADFGVAIRANGEAWTPLRESAPIGNLAFMSPEQYRMEADALTIPTDIYALGGILYWLLTQQLPNGATPEDIRRTHDTTSVRAAITLSPQCPDADRDLESIVRRALAIDPRQRFGSAAEFADSLESWARQEPLPWTAPSPLWRLKLWRRRSPKSVVGAAVMLLLLVSAGVALFQAAVAHKGLQSEAGVRRKLNERNKAFRERLKNAINNDLAHEVLPQIWLEEWIYEPTVFGGDQIQQLALWELRTDAVKNLLARWKQFGGKRTFHTLLWESALAFWLIKDGKYDEAEPIIEENAKNWRSLLDADDPWILHLDAMRTCVFVGKWGRDASAGHLPSPSDRERLVAAAELLQHASRMAHEMERTGPLHFVVVSHLITLYQPALLDMPDRLAAAERELELINE